MTTALGIEMAIGIDPGKEGIDLGRGLGRGLGRDLERDPAGAIQMTVTQAETNPPLLAGSRR